MSDQKPTSLDDYKAKKEQEHANRVIQLFKDHPELAKEAIVVYAPEGGEGVVLAPEHLGTTFVVGLLEAAKFGILASSMQDPT